MVELYRSMAPPSIMARQPASKLGLIFFVAIDTEPHLKFLCRNPVKGLDLSVAVLALNVPFDVPDVLEKNKFRYIDGFFPGRRRIGIKIMVFLLNRREFGNNVFVTVETFLNRGYSGKCRPADIRVAKLTLNVLDARVDTVAERDGLYGTDSGCRRGIIKKEKTQNQSNTQPGPQQRDPVFYQYADLPAQGGDELHGFAFGADNHRQDQDRR
jgi:hypothetical protein